MPNHLFPEHMLSVRATVEPGREAEFNRWYDKEHMPDAVRMFPGCIGGARYKVVLGDGSHQYMALYAFESAAKLEQALNGPEVKELIKIYDRDIGSFSTRARTTYERVLLHTKK
jgi:antibiotic biosynthesis monooxygenase (ABM) superfamily enzyme